MIASPGIVGTHQAVVMNSRPRATIEPYAGSGGGTPAPRKLSGRRLEEVALDLRLQSEDQDPLREVRPAFFRGLGLVECPVYDHYRLRVGAQITGPAIVEQRESTCVIGPADVARTDQWRNLMITVG